MVKQDVNFADVKDKPSILVKDFDLTEIINGEEIMSPSPLYKHQRLIRNINRIVINYVYTRKLGRLLVSPLDVIFEEGANRLQPDLLYIKNDNLSIIQDWIRGAPDMVCEIVSEGSLVKDTIIKKEIYEHYKVPEYWIVIPQLNTIEIFTLENDRYHIRSSAVGEGIVKSKVIEGLEINIKDVFEEY